MTSRLTCLIWGHAVDNRVFVAEGRACTRCGTTLLRDDPAPVRIGHTLSCFLSHHTYEPVGARDGHMEYACVRCGHPLLFPLDADPYSERHRFQKRVRYACGLFGHHVHPVGERNGGVEYACHCGHSFLKRDTGSRKIRHPLICFFRAHRIRFLARRCGYAEYVCTDCGHPFCFADQTGS